MNIEIPTRTPSPHSADDTILPFEVAALDLRGRVVRLGPAVDDILTRHDYPAPVSKLLGEAIALAALFGSSLKFDGRFILQTQGDGPVRMLVVDYVTGGRMRACARFDTQARRGRDRSRPGFGRRIARPRPSGHDHRSGRRHEPLSGSGRARRRRARRCGARIFPALGADPDPRAARGRRGIAPRRWRREISLARRRHHAAIPAQVARAHAHARSRSGRRAGRRDDRGDRGRRCLGGRRVRWWRRSRISN